jgi:hypothetical protein
MKLPAGFWILAAVAALATAAEAPGFKLTKKYPVPGDGGFDYIVFDGRPTVFMHRMARR